MNLEDVILSGVSQTRKDKHCTIPLKNGEFYDTHFSTIKKLVIYDKP